MGAVVEATSRIAVPLFFMISGYYAFGRNKTAILKSVKKTAVMLIWAVCIYFLWEILWSFYRGTTQDKLDAFFSVETLVETLVFNTGVLLGHLWFLLALLYCYLIYAFALKERRRRTKLGIAAVLLGGFFGIRELLKINGVSDPMYYLRNFLFVGMPFFLLGSLCSQQKAQLTSVSAKVWLVLILGGTAAAIAERLLVGSCDLYLGTVAASGGLFLLTQTKSSANELLAKLGYEHAGNIYIFHVIVIGVLNMAGSLFGVLNSMLFLLLRPFAAIAGSIVISFLKNQADRKLRRVLG